VSPAWSRRAGPLALVIALLLLLAGEAPFVLALRHAIDQFLDKGPAENPRTTR